MVVLTRTADPTADLVITELTARGVPVARFDPADFPLSVRLTARLGGGAGLTGRIRLLAGNREVDLADVRAVYYRRPSPFTFLTLAPEDRPWAIAQARYGLGGVLMALPGCRYVNHPDAVAAAEPKPVQLATAHAVGLPAPPTIVTDSVDDARAFAAEVGPIVYKPIHHAPYHKDGRPAAVWTTEVDPSQFDATIRQTAHLFQAKIDKVADVRVTVVGDRVFAAIARDAELDWRTRQDRLAWQPVEPPSETVKAMLAYLDRFGLAFGCFDFAVDHAGRWWFLECNPNGQWAFIQEKTGIPIAAAFADLLATGRA
ncbi:ATP-grasp ribosomal peptide maturase [Carbonactinospora thermoautotrophica]|nr:ATP-grasp ribosomal peptide maturase [Carbonactinospora thermoautotrophica]